MQQINRHDRDSWERFLVERGIGWPEGNLVDEDPPEPVDEAKLRAFHNAELNGPDREWVAFLISRYRAWHDADLRIADVKWGDDNGEA